MATKRKAMKLARKLAKAAGADAMNRVLDKRNKRPRAAVQQIAVSTGRARYEHEHRRDSGC